MSEFTLPEAVGDTDIHVCGVFVKQVIFLTVNHRGPLPLRELHSTDDTIVWRDPGGSWACLRPVSDYKWIHPFRVCRWHRHTCMWHPFEAGHFSYDLFLITSEFTLSESVGDTDIHVCGILVKQVIFLTVNHRGPLPLRELHSTDDTIVWRDPGGSWACLRPVSDYEWIHPFRVCRWHRHTCMWRPCEAGRFSYGESPRTPPLEGTSLHRRHNRYSVERPWGILSLFTTCFRLWVNSPFQRLEVTRT